MKRSRETRVGNDGRSKENSRTRQLQRKSASWTEDGLAREVHKMFVMTSSETRICTETPTRSTLANTNRIRRHRARFEEAARSAICGWHTPDEPFRTWSFRGDPESRSVRFVPRTYAWLGADNQSPSRAGIHTERREGLRGGGTPGASR